MVICPEQNSNDVHNAYGTVNAIATPSSLTSLKSTVAYLFGVGFPCCPGKAAIKQALSDEFLQRTDWPALYHVQLK